jgi:formylglycine-generating enzyme required for sulfatase activity
MPPADATADFLRAIEASGFLTAAQLTALRSWAQLERADSQAVARELNKRAWLTGYQIKEIFRGRGKSLLVGPYRILDLIGEGGMGRVFRAVHTRLGRDVALKVIRREKLASPLTVRRFRQEIQAVATLSHPNVVLAFDADEAGGDHFLAMEFVDGVDLTKLVRDHGPMPIPLACDYIRQAALGLHHAYERGLVHRDVKPSNLIAAKTGQVKVLDLGLAMLNETHQSEKASRVTQEGFVIGTPDFLAPEQARNPQNVDTRADVYALGATLFYLLTGKVPYEGATPTEKLVKHVTDPPPSLLARLPHAPPQLDALIQWMMAKGPGDRPQTPAQAAMALVPFCPPPSGSHPHPTAHRPPSPFALEPEGSSQAFKLPASEAPARVRERARHAGGLTGWLVTLVAAVTVGTLGYMLYRFTLMPDPPPTPEFTNPIGMKFVLMTGGTFVMGSPDNEPGRGPEEGPAGEVTLDRPFYVGVTEVTNGQYQELMGSSPAWTVSRVPGAGEWPVEQVTWADAQEFCKRLNARDRGKRRGWAYRLPTEAEWEFACRGGTTTPFAFGDQLLPEHGEAVAPPPPQEKQPDAKPAKIDKPNKVGRSSANPFGLIDCHGNVAEWCQDYYARGYPPGPRTNPTGPTTGDLRAVRGGAFDEPMARARSAARRGELPDRKDRSIGFRVVLAPVP